MPNTKKFLDAAGVTYLASLLDNYPNNEILGTVINAIQDALDEKADTSDLYDDTALAARVTALEQLPWVTYHTGTSTPSNSLGENGDLYLETSSS